MSAVTAWFVYYVYPKLAFVIALLFCRSQAKNVYAEACSRALSLVSVGRPSMFIPIEANKSLSVILDTSSKKISDNHQMIWLAEGIAIAFYKDAYLHKDQKIKLKDEKLKSEYVVVAHTGMAMGYTQTMLKKYKKLDEQSCKEFVEDFVDFCKTNGRTDCLPLMVEALGVSIVVFYKQKFLVELAKELHKINPQYSNLLWHGAGRGMYFHWQNLFSNYRVRWPNLKKVVNLPSTIESKQNLIAGYFLAGTLVNIKHQGTIENMVNESRSYPGIDEAVVHGIASAAAAEIQCSGSATYSKTIVSMSPALLSNDIWQAYIALPMKYGFTTMYNTLTPTTLASDIFQYKYVKIKL